MFRDFVRMGDRHGCRDLGLVRVLRAKVQPPDMPPSHVSSTFSPTVNALLLPRSS